MPRAAVLICSALLTLQSAVAGEAAAPAAAGQQAADLLGQTEAAAVDAVLEKAFAGGFPDLAGAALVLGKVQLSLPEPADGDDGFDDVMMGPVDSSSADGRLTLTIDGLHLRCADGRWLVGMHRLIAPTAERTVTADPGAVEVARGRLGHELAQRSNPAEDAEDDRFLALFVPADRERLHSAMAQARVFRGLAWNASPHLTVGILRRLQAIDTSGMLVCLAAADTTPWMETRLAATAPPLGLDVSGWHGGWSDGIDYEAWQRERTGTLRLPPSDRGLAIAFSAWFQMLLCDPAALASARLDPARAAATARELLPDDLRPARAPDIDALVARLAIPPQAPAGADLPTRLQSWLPGRMHGMFVDDGDGPDFSPEMLQGLPAEQRARMQAMVDAARAWKPGAGDIPGLLALLEDGRPSRWLDMRTPRTVGDCSLRALATVLRFDPRLLVGRRPAAPWTPAERSATATALRAWWNGLAGRPLADGLAEAIPALPAEAVAALLRAATPDERTARLDRLAAAWSASMPADLPPRDLGAILALAGGHAGIAGAITKLPVAGRLRPLLACWHDQAGQPGHLDTLLAELTTQAPADDDDASRLGLLLSQAMHRPSPARLQVAMRLRGGAFDDRRTWAALAALAPRSYGGGEDWDAVMALHNGRSGVDDDGDAGLAARAIPLAVAASALADPRPLPDGLAVWQVQESWATVQLPGLHAWVQSRGRAPSAGAPPRVAPTGMRVNDIATLIIANDPWSLGLQDMHGDEHHLDPWQTPPERDRIIAAWSAATLEAARTALQAAQLPDVLPAAATPEAGDKALF